MELIAVSLVIVSVFLVRGFAHPTENKHRPSRPARSGAAPKPVAARPKPKPIPARTWTGTPHAPATLTPKARRALALVEEARRAERCILTGKAWVVDGDTIVIDGVHIRLAGIDAPELDHPYGQASKWAMVRLCRGRTVTARIRPELSYDRVVAHCRLDDGTDLAEALVSRGLALDWPAFSKGHYARFEPPGIRKKLWKTAIRQRG